MKNTTVLTPRYDLIKLYRKAVHDPDNTKNNTQTMLAMDYFDALEVCRFDPDTEEFNEFMGLCIYENLTEHDMAMQSIPLYCPEINEEMIDEYQCGNNCYRDPFGDDAEDFRYFGMVQVHITPEILVKFDLEGFKNSKSKDHNSIYLSIYHAFFKDIHLLISEFVCQKYQKSEEDIFRYCIYQSMSVGDFVVAIKCRDPEVPFEVASMLRRRKIDLEKPVSSKNGNDCNGFVLYKTYTLLSLNTQIIRADSEINDKLDDNEITRRFVLRCVLSNRYWSKEKDYSLKRVLDKTTCSRLHGRYDFTVTLSEKAFLYIHPKLVRYKIGNKVGIDDSKNVIPPEDKNEREICDFIESLMEDNCISYINERFMFRDREEDIEASNYNLDIKLVKTEENFLFANEYNAKRLEKLKDLVRHIYQRTLKLDTSRHSIVYSMRLLERFINLCSSINGISDSRIYCYIIIHQIEIVLEAVGHYLSYLDIPVVDGVYPEEGDECTDNEYYELTSALDIELKSALEYMNSFAKFILDSSLQSLQTPHYNLETHVSVEKLLLSYSYFVHWFFNWYNGTKAAKDIGCDQYEYYTLMVPQPMDSSLVTRTLFNWKKVKELKERLLVVRCPSFDDLTDFKASIGILLHEIAHSIRYEDRKTRNRMILEYGYELLFDQVSKGIAMDLWSNIPDIDDYEFYLETIREWLAESYMKHIGLGEEEYLDKSFSILISEMEERYKEFVDAVEYLTRLRRYLKTLQRDFKFRLNEEYDDIFMRAEQLYQVFFGFKQPKKADPKAYIEAYNDLVLSLEEFELNKKQKVGNDSHEAESIDHLKDYLFDLYDPNDSTNDEETEEFLEFCVKVVCFEREVNDRIRTGLMNQRNRINSRMIARYLRQGTYANLDKREGDFAGYAESFIVLTEEATLKTYNRMMDFYRETTSDLYMVRLLGLTPYGYLNFYTWNIPVDNIIPETYLRRFCLVLYALLELKEEERNEWDHVCKKMDEEIQEMYILVWKHISAFVNRYSREKYADVLIGEIDREDQVYSLRISDYLKQIGEKIGSYMKDKCEVLMIDHLNLMTEVAVAIKDSLKPCEDGYNTIKQEEFVIELMHCRYLCSNLISLLYEWKSQLQSIWSFETLTCGLHRGSEKLDQIHKEFTESDLWKYCEHIAEYYNEKQMKPMNRVDANKLMAEFVLDMSYSMLYSSAQDMK
ncbi:MAG: hypothetical protein Q4D71_08640 [Oscillospiraceae bacterium]|nr:hypothetical protein [Oscillospiraceae bacterium]